MDADVLILGSAIASLFEVRPRYDLWALQTASDPRGKISWPITRVNLYTKLRIQEHRRIRRPPVLTQLRRVLAICDNLRRWPTRRSRAT
jgi:hypothetical protein